MNIETIVSAARPHLRASTVFVAVALVFGLFFVMNTPLLWGSDETSHIARAYQISEGHVFSQKLTDVAPRGGGYGGNIPATLHTLIAYVDHNLLTTGYVGKANIAQYNKIGKLPINSAKSVEYAFPNAAPYSPVVYLPSALAIWIARVANFSLSSTIYLARLFQLLAYIGIVYLALRILRNSKTKWVVFVVGLMPVAIAQASIITADTLTNGVILLFLAFMIKGFLKSKYSKAELATLLATSLVLPLVKPTYVVLCLLLLFIPHETISSNIKKSRVFKTLGLLAALCTFLTWSLLTKDTLSAVRLIIPGNIWMYIHPHQQIKVLEHNPLIFVKALIKTLLVADAGYIYQMFGSFGFNGFQIPGTTFVLYLTALFVSAGIAEKIKLKFINNLAIILIIIGGVVGIFLTEYIAATPVKATIVDSTQGRYFLPYLLLLTFWITANVRTRLSAKNYNPQIAIVSMVVVGLILTCAKFWYITYHHAIGPS